MTSDAHPPTYMSEKKLIYLLSDAIPKITQIGRSSKQLGGENSLKEGPVCPFSLVPPPHEPPDMTIQGDIPPSK